MRKPRHREDNLPEVAPAVSGNPGLQSVRAVTPRTHILHGAVNFMCQHDSVTGCPGMASTRLQVCLQAVPSGIRTRMGGLSGATALPRGWAPPGPGEGRRTRPLCRLPALDIRLLPLGWDSHRQLSWSPAFRWQTVGRPSLQNHVSQFLILNLLTQQ